MPDGPRLEIGGGTHRLWPDARQLDPLHGDPDLRVLVQDGIPMPDGTFSAAIASHVMEHIPAGRERIRALNEVQRVLVRGGSFRIIVPCVGYTDPGGAPVHTGWQGYADPTHVSFWWYPESFLYLVEGNFKAHADYGLHDWQLGVHELKSGWEAHVELIKP